MRSSFRAIMEAAAKTLVKLSSKSLRRNATASQSQVTDWEETGSIAMSASSSCPHDSSSKEPKQDCDNIFEEEALNNDDLSISIDKGGSQSTDVDDSTTDVDSSPEKLCGNVVMKANVVNGHGKHSPLKDNMPLDSGQNEEEEDPMSDLINSDGSIDAFEMWFMGSKSGTKRSSATEAESSSLKKIRLDSKDEKFKTELKDNANTTLLGKPDAGSPDKQSDSPNTSSYFSELEKSVLEQVFSVVDNKEKDVEVLTQGSLSIEHLLKSNNCPLCLKRSDKIVVHVKKCAAKKKVSTDKLFDAIKLQLKQHQEREAIGLPPSLSPKKKCKKKAVPSAAAVPEGYDSSIELAKALSASLKESQETFGNVDVEGCAESSAVLQSKDDNAKKSAPIFGSASSSSSTGKLRGGSSLLFNRTEEDRERIVTEKVAIVLLHSDGQDNLITETAPVIPSSSKMNENLNKENSPIREQNNYGNNTTDEGSQSASSSSSKQRMERSRSPNPSFKPENETAIETHVPNPEKQEFNAPIAVRKMNKTSRSYRNNWRDVFEDRVMCDITVVVDGDFEIEVHRLVLRAQCPVILDEVITRFTAENMVKSFIIWDTIPKDVASAFFEYIYCEDLGKANNLPEDRLKIFMNKIEQYRIAGLKFIMKDIRINNEMDITEHHRDIDEATTATNSSVDELSNALIVENVAGKDCRAPLSSPSHMRDDFENDNFYSNKISSDNSTRTPTVDKSKVVKYPFKKRARQNTDSNSCEEITKVLPSFSNINKRSRKSQRSYTRKCSPRESLTIDCNSAESFGDVQIIEEKKKVQQKELDIVITLSDDSDNDTVVPTSTGSSNSSGGGSKKATVTRPRGSGIGCKKMYEVTDAESEGNVELNEGTGVSIWNDEFNNFMAVQSDEFSNKEPPEASEVSFENVSSLASDYNQPYGYKQIVPKSMLSFDPLMPSTSKAAAQFEEWAAKCPTNLPVTTCNSAETSAASQKIINEAVTNTSFYNRHNPIRPSIFCERSRDSPVEDLGESKSHFGEPQTSNSYKFTSQLYGNCFAMNIKAKPSDVFDSEPNDLWMNPDDHEISPARDCSNQTFQNSSNVFKNLIQNRRKRHCSATITSSELDADNGKIMKKSPEITDAGWHEPVLDSALKTKSNVSLLNVDDEIFKNVQTPDTSAGNNTSEMKHAMKGNDSLLRNNTDRLNYADPIQGSLVDNYHSPSEKSWYLPVPGTGPVGPVKVVPIEGVNEFPNPYENLFSTLPVPQEDIAIERVNEVPILPLNEDPVERMNEVPLVQVNEVLVKREDEVPLLPVNEALLVPVNEAPVKRVNEVPLQPDNEALVERENEALIAPVNDVPIVPGNDDAAGELILDEQLKIEAVLEPVHSPRPNFAKMKKLELMEHLEKCGVKKNLTVVRARKLLSHIYDFTHQEVKGKGKKVSTKRPYDPLDLKRFIDREITEAAGNVHPDVGPDAGPGPAPDVAHTSTLINKDEAPNQTRLTLEEALIGGDNLSETYRELLELEVKRVISNTEEFECPTCFDLIEVRGGIVLKDCAHSICRTCLTRLVESTDEALITCPCCPSVIQHREIKEVVAPEIFERYLSKSLAVTANSIENAFHCKSPNCSGWCIIDDVINQPVNVFRCPVCLIDNCVQCQAIHPSMNCLQYQNHLAIQAEKDPIAKKSLLYLEKLKKNKKALNCPKCKIVIVKTEGCDWIRCSMCKCEICWATMGPRWGPKGFGDVSGGCRCKMNGGAPCTKNCKNCH